MGGDGARAGARAAHLPAGLPCHAVRPAGAGPHRSPLRRADGRDRVRHRDLRAAAGLQAARDPRPGRQGARHDERGQAPAHRRGRRNHQRRRCRAARRVRRADRRSRHPDAHGLGRDPGRPPADGRHGRAADRAPLRQRDDARVRLRARDRQSLGEPPHRLGGRLHQGTQVRSRRRRADADRPGVQPGSRDRLGRESRARAVRRGRARTEGARVGRGSGRLGRRMPRAQEDHAAPDPFRGNANQAAARLRGDEQGLRQGRLLRLDHRPVADRGRPVPPRLQAEALDQLRPGGALGLDHSGQPSASGPPTPNARSSRSPAITISSS